MIFVLGKAVYCALLTNKNIMKNKLLGLLLIALLCAGKVAAQDVQSTENKENPSVEKSIRGIQIGETGLIYNYEFKLANKITLRTEAGFTLAFFSGDENLWTGEKEKGSVAALPTFTVEPRWYYNLNRRVRKGKDITRNRANYFSLFANYSGGWGAIKFDDRVDQTPNFITIAPMWGMRRTLGKHFNYELGAGIGYYYVSKHEHFTHSHTSDDEIVLIVKARFGFDF